MIGLYVLSGFIVACILVIVVGTLTTKRKG